ncbi:MAG: hypothetical protein GY795_37205 [Desulfobacterales bacterium]|nr:hypothetical protein [Desulfobacterales bacterium]
MLRKISGLSIFWFFLTTALFLPGVRAENYPETENFEAEIEDEFAWLQEEAFVEFATVATKTEMKAQDAPSIVSVITGEQIRNMWPGILLTY